MKQKFEDLTEYEVSVDYDEKGFINKIIILGNLNVKKKLALIFIEC